MTKTLDCPQCGAPIDSADIDPENDATVTCRYCAKVIIVPPELRRRRPVVQTIEINYTQPDQPSTPEPYQIPVQPTRRSPVVGCILAVVALSVIGSLIATFSATALTAGLTAGLINSIDKVVPGIVEPQATATDLASALQTQLAPAYDQATEAAKQLETVIPRVTPTPRSTPTPKANLTATHEAAQAELDALNAQMTKPRAWPLALEEKFTNDSRGWNTGTDNGTLALEQLTIAGGRYVWQFTSKKPMASFSYPTMPEQTDAYISVDMQLQSATGNAEDQAGIIFRHSEADKTFYFFAVNPLGVYSLSLYNGTGWDILIPTSETSLLKRAGFNHLGVLTQDGQIVLEINNQVVDSFDDPSLTSGIAGLGLHLPAPGEDAQVIFSNFSVRAPK